MTPAGFPHSEIHGSKLESSSPWLIAGFRVLHRLLVPRHPPCALCSLTKSHASRHGVPQTTVVARRLSAPSQMSRVRGSFRHHEPIVFAMLLQAAWTDGNVLLYFFGIGRYELVRCAAARHSRFFRWSCSAILVSGSAPRRRALLKTGDQSLDHGIPDGSRLEASKCPRVRPVSARARSSRRLLERR